MLVPASIYDEVKQAGAMERALEAISLSISQNTSGQNEGPWAEAMTDSCARNTAQLLLGIVVGFKRSPFQGEKRMAYRMRSTSRIEQLCTPMD